MSDVEKIKQNIISSNALADKLYGVIQQHFEGSTDPDDGAILGTALDTVILAVQEQSGSPNFKEKIIKILQLKR